jgi:hypothetical protein
MASQPDQPHSYLIFVAFESTSFRKIEMDDPVPLGRQILTASGYHADDDFSLYNIVETGDFEDVRLDEEIDLRRPRAGRFIIFKSDRDFKLTLNQRQLLWGLPAISGTDLYALSEPADDQALFLVCPGAQDRQIDRGDTVDLTSPGVEHFITVRKRHHELEIVINGRKTRVLERRVTFEQLVALAYPGVPPQPNVAYTVTFRKVASFPHEGELATGAFVEVKNGSIFNVGRTVQS